MQIHVDSVPSHRRCLRIQHRGEERKPKQHHEGVIYAHGRRQGARQDHSTSAGEKGFGKRFYILYCVMKSNQRM